MFIGLIQYLLIRFDLVQIIYPWDSVITGQGHSQSGTNNLPIRLHSRLHFICSENDVVLFIPFVYFHRPHQFLESSLCDASWKSKRRHITNTLPPPPISIQNLTIPAAALRHPNHRFSLQNLIPIRHTKPRRELHPDLRTNRPPHPPSKLLRPLKETNLLPMVPPPPPLPPSRIQTLLLGLLPDPPHRLPRRSRRRSPRSPNLHEGRRR